MSGGLRHKNYGWGLPPFEGDVHPHAANYEWSWALISVAQDIRDIMLEAEARRLRPRWWQLRYWRKA